jgi:hypothetical protein
MAASILSVCFMVYHPRVHAHGMAEFVEAVRAELLVNGVVHGSLIALLAVLAAGYSVLTTRIDGVLARMALVSFGLGVVCGTAAASINGLIMPQFVLAAARKSSVDLESIRPILDFCHAANQVCSRIWIVAAAAAVLLWSLALLKRSGPARTVGVLGALLGLTPLAALALGYLPMDVHGVLGFIVTQTIWSVAVGVLLIRGRA